MIHVISFCCDVTRTLTRTPRLLPAFGRAPPVAIVCNRQSGLLQGSKLTGKVMHNQYSIIAPKTMMGHERRATRQVEYFGCTERRSQQDLRTGKAQPIHSSGKVITPVGPRDQALSVIKIRLNRSSPKSVMELTSTLVNECNK